MLKTFLIGLKDLRLVFRDRTALILMLVAPFALTVGLGFVTGRFSGGNFGILNNPMILVYFDKKQNGNCFVDVFNSKNLAGLGEPIPSSRSEAGHKFFVDEKTADGSI